jgi:5'-deoxynucleotidase YfbR-like HD superfamily hydrolase
MWSIQNLIVGGEVQRYHTWPVSKQTVGCHSWGVAMIAQRLWPKCRKELLLAALEHDLGEQVMGDVPAMAKWRAPKFFEEFEKAEAEARTQFGFNASELSPEEQQVLKLADILELTAWAKIRVLCGELSANRVLQNGYRYSSHLISLAPASTNWALEANRLLAEISHWNEFKTDDGTYKL